MTARDAALTYASRGWRVHPIPPGHKYPAGYDRWQDNATTDPQLITQWYDQHPGHGVCIATGEASGVFVLDVDCAAGKVGFDSFTALEDQHGPLPPTVEAITGTGGRHLYYRHPAGLELNNSAGRLGPDLDIRANGGQVVAAPTLHPDTGQAYAWDLERHPDDTPIADAPPWLLALLQPPPKVEAGPRGDYDRALLAWDRFNLAPDIANYVALMLGEAGWTEGRPGRDDVRYLTRPGKADGISASLGKVAPGVLFCFTGSAPPLEAERSYDPSDLLALLHFGGDRAAADADLVRQGWGIASHSITAGDVTDWIADNQTPGQQAAAMDEQDKAAHPLYVDWSELFDRERSDDEWLLEPILATGRAHVIYAPHKVGKSLLTLWAALSLATGTQPVVVIYLDYEMGEDDLQERVEDMGYGPASDLTRLRYALLPYLPPLDTREGGDAVMALVRAEQEAWPDHHIAVVIDTTGRAVAGEENSADTIREFYSHTGIRLKRAGVTWVRLDHAGKDKAKGMRGSSAKGDDVDVVWAMSANDMGGLKLDLTAARMGWVPQTVSYARGNDPLTYSRDEEEWPAGTADMMKLLDSIGVPLDDGWRKARKTLAAGGHKAPQQVLIKALKRRRMKAETGTITGGPEATF